ncbi:MAG: helix-turn-helix transcriptional regulator [Gammaproteobacteria bacterium]|nr:MAG: helix-turn-helix transcriptional regulator [Gammaproteobacteria bacterium]
MSRVGSDLSAAKRRHHAAVFAALADETRLALVTTLSGGEPRSIAQLTGGSRMTRQAITKHLRVLECAGIVHSVRSGRESRFAFDPAPLNELKEYLGRVSAQWDQVLSRLKTLVES